MVAYLDIGVDLEAGGEKPLVGGGGGGGPGLGLGVGAAAAALREQTETWWWLRCCRKRRRSCGGQGPSGSWLPAAARPLDGGGEGHPDVYVRLATPRGLARQSGDATPDAGGARTPQPGGSEEEDFFDAQSDAEDSLAPTGALAGPLPVVGVALPPAAAAARAAAALAEADQRLRVLLGIERRCREQGANENELNEEGSVGELQVENVLIEEASQLWFCRSKSCPFIIGCMRCVLPGVHVEDAVESIRNPQHRLHWDGESFSHFEVVRASEPWDPTHEDALFTVMPAPKPVRDREVLQRRWQVPLGDGGAQALLMQSFEDDALRAPDPKRVRAFTHLSGYLLRPIMGGKGLEVVVISQIDLGGALPGWFQNVARRLAKRRCLAWGQKLQRHCQGLASSRCGVAA